MTVRAMTADDAVTVGTLLACSFPQELAPYLPYAQPGTPSFLEDELARMAENPAKHFLIYAEDQEVAGYAEYRLDRITSAFLSYICVAGWARGRGVAKAVMQQFFVDHPAVNRLELDVFEDNIPARRLYEGLGFVNSAKTAWYRRPLPSASEPLRITDVTSVLQTQARYGFSRCQFEFEGEVHTVGRIGDGVVRCYDYRDFASDSFLARVRATFPGANEALLLGAATEQSPLPDDCSIIVRSLRMVWEALEADRGLG